MGTTPKVRPHLEVICESNDIRISPILKSLEMFDTCLRSLVDVLSVYTISYMG